MPGKTSRRVRNVTEKNRGRTCSLALDMLEAAKDEHMMKSALKPLAAFVRIYRFAYLQAEALELRTFNFLSRPWRAFISAAIIHGLTQL